MNPNETHPANLPATDWQILGELLLTPGSDVEQEIRAWLMAILLPLALHETFLNKLYLSAHEYGVRALHSTAQAGHGHVHLAILTQQGQETSGHAWGFFRIEKIDSVNETAVHPDHVVEFYLYVEGQ